MRRGSIVAIAIAFAWAPGARAQDASPQVDEFSTLTFSPAPGPGNFLAVDGALVRGHLSPSVGLTFDYAHEPFVLYTAECDEGGANCEVTGVDTALVRFTAFAHVTATLSVLERLQIGVVIPVGFVAGDGFEVTLSAEDRVTLPGGSAFAVADPRLHLKARLLGGPAQLFRLAAVAWASAPLGQQIAEGRYVGDPSVAAGGHLVAELEGGGFRFAVNAGGVWREEAQLFSTRVGPAFTYAGALGWDVTPLFSILGEVQGATAFGGQVDENPLEGRLGLRLLAGDFAFTLAGGAGIRSGVGVPVFRGLASVAWSSSRKDSDGDGVGDDRDACPSAAEDMDGWLDDDGCPDEDNDADGLADGVDPCPNEAEDHDGFEDEDGCPDVDNDGDGVTDGYDSCPNDPEDVDDDRDEDGCPDTDADRDGVPDDQDQCPDQPEDTDGYGDLDGCPEDDFDGDGLPDDGGDYCPDQPETVNGFEDDDGCPEEDTDGDGIVDQLDRCPAAPETFDGRADGDGCPDGDALVTLDGHRVVLAEEIAFDRRNGVRRSSRRLVVALGRVIDLHPELGPVLVQVTAASFEEADARAASIQRILVRQGGVAPERLAVLPEEGDTPRVVVTGTPPSGG